jgi:thiol-disulfide isomerase/thioredoxin
LEKEFLVACLCADWCDTCREYRPGFEALAGEFPDADFLWFDIEDDADEVGDLEVEDFPTLLIQRGENVVFYGSMLPHIGHLRRALEVLRSQSSEESRRLASSTEERRAWQEHCNLRRRLKT